MTDNNKTLIAFLVDRSGSMHGIKYDMENGIKAFLDEQKKLPGEVEVTLAQFDNEYKLVYPPTDINSVPEYELLPRGLTALNDAVGKFITDIGADLAAREEDDRPGLVIVNIITDGYENDSTEWTLAGVRDLMDQQRDLYKWEFVFMGSDVTTETTAQGYGIAPNRIVRYATEAVDSGMNAGSFMTSQIRGGFNKS